MKRSKTFQQMVDELKDYYQYKRPGFTQATLEAVFIHLKINWYKVNVNTITGSVVLVFPKFRYMLKIRRLKEFLKEITPAHIGVIIKKEW